MSDQPDQAGTPTPKPSHPSESRRWVGPALLTLLVVLPIVVLIFSNLEATEVSWAGFRFNQPRWLVLLVTFVAGMAGGKLGGWGWRRWRKRRKKLKEELDILRKHAPERGSTND